MTLSKATCLRCGVRRTIHGVRSTNLCRDCKVAETPQLVEVDPLPKGEWITTPGGVRSFQRQPGRPLRPCGTLAAYRRHLRAGETPCVDCSDASRDYTRKARGITEPKPLEPHGTHAAYHRHYRAGIPFCDPCIEAERAYQREAKRSIRARKAA